MAEVLLIKKLEERSTSLLRNKRLRDGSNPFEMNEVEFVNKFRLSREAAKFLCKELEPHLQVASNGIPLEFLVLTTLRLLGSGSFQTVIADASLIQVSQSTVSRHADKVIQALLKIAKKFIKFPTSYEDVSSTMRGFYEKLHFPNALGAVDCTHIEINRPGTPDWFQYVNRKGKFSINVQMICDANLKIIDVVARWPGSTHDSFIWNLSAAKHIFTSRIMAPEIFLLGDSGYPLEPWLLTPFLDPCCPSESIFNEKHKSARNVIERCFGVLKSRFRILSQSGGTLGYSPEKVCFIVIAGAVLHNICVKFNQDIATLDIMPDDDLQDPVAETQEQNPSAVIIRNQIARRFQAAR